MGSLLKIGEIAARSGVTAKTIRSMKSLSSGAESPKAWRRGDDGRSEPVEYAPPIEAVAATPRRAKRR